MPDITTNALQIVMFDGIGESVTPTANFSPPSGYPLSRLGEHHLQRRTRTVDLSGTAQLTWDLGAAVESNVFMLAGSNATLDVQGRFLAADDGGFTVNVVESDSILQPVYGSTPLASRTTYLPPWGRVVVYVHPQTVTRRYVRWQQTDAGNPDGYQSWAVARVGKSIQLGRVNVDDYPDTSHPNAFAGFLTDWSMSTQIVGTAGSQKSLRQHEFEFSLLDRSRCEEIVSLLMMSRGRRMLAIPEPDKPETFPGTVFWGEFLPDWQKSTDNRTPYDDKRFKVSCTFREVDQ